MNRHQESKSSSSRQTLPNGNVYFNINIPNNASLQISPPATPAQFFEVRSDSIISGKPSDYTLSIVRASIPTATIPIKVIEIIQAPTNTDINKTVYSITLSWNGFDSQQNIIWISQSAVAQVPQDTISTSHVNAKYVEYYSLFSVQHFINLINTAFAAAAAELLADHTAPTTHPPFLYLDPISNRISLYADANYNSNTGTVGIFMNNFLSNNFGNSFDTIYQGRSSLVGKNVQYLVYNRDGKNTETIGGVAYFVMTQEYITKSNLSSFASLVFSSNNIPVRNELISSQFATTNQTSSSFFRILQDLEIDAIPNDVSFNSLTYNPSAEYRRMSLLTENRDDLRTIDIQIYWKDNYDNYYLLYILPGDIATIKFLFEKIR